MGKNMSGKTKTGVHWSFWVIGVVTLIWNAMGAANYIAQLDPVVVATFPDSHRALIVDRPAWATGAFAIAVFGGTIGCVLLLFKKSISYYLFIASFLGVIITMVHTFSVKGSTANSGSADFILTILLPLIIAGFLVWYSKWIAKNSWIK